MAEAHVHPLGEALARTLAEAREGVKAVAESLMTQVDVARAIRHATEALTNG